MSVIWKSVPDCSTDDVVNAIARLYRRECLKVEIWYKSLNGFRDYQSKCDDLKQIQFQVWLQETSHTEAYFAELQKLSNGE